MENLEELMQERDSLREMRENARAILNGLCRRLEYLEPQIENAQRVVNPDVVESLTVGIISYKGKKYRVECFPGKFLDAARIVKALDDGQGDGAWGGLHFQTLDGPGYDCILYPQTESATVQA